MAGTNPWLLSVGAPGGPATPRGNGAVADDGLGESGDPVDCTLNVVWLPSAGHTGWVSDWPLDVRAECEQILGAMGPRILVAICVPNQDHQGRLIPAREFAEQLRRDITEATGGQTTYRGEGDYRPPDGLGLAEDTLVIETFLPTVVNDALRLRLIGLFVDFGRRACQDAVLVQVGSHGFWIPTKSFRQADTTLDGANREVALKTG